MAIKTQLEASGVTQFKQQMQQAAGEVKALGAELKLAEAEFQATGDKATYLKQKSQLLQQQLAAQKKSVEAAEKALEAVKKQFGENSTQAQAWRTKLATARATLVQTESMIRKTDEALDALNQDDLDAVTGEVETLGQKVGETKTKSDELGESVGGIAQKMDIETITRGIDAVTGAMDNVIAKAAQMGKAIWEASTDATEWADSTRDAATAAKMGVEEYQRIAYAAQFFGTSIDGLVAQQGKLVKAMDGGEALTVGTQTIETSGRAWVDVMMDVIDGLGTIEDSTEQDAASMEIFGKGYKELAGLVAAGSAEFKQRFDEAPVVREETVNNLADTADVLKTMDARLEALKMETLNALAPSITTIAEAVGTLADNLTKYLQSEEGQAMLAELAGAIESVVNELTNVDFNQVVTDAKDVLTGLTGAFEWLADHKDAVVAAIKAIATSMIALKTASIGLKTAETILSLKNLLSGGAGGGGGGGGGTGGAGTGTFISKALAKVTPFMSNAFWTAGVPLAALFGSVAPAVMAQNADVANRDKEITAQVEAAQEAANAMGDAASEYMDVVHVAEKALGIDYNAKDWMGMTMLGDPAKVWKGLNALEPYAEMLSDFMSESDMAALDTFWHDLDNSTLTDADLDQLMTRVLKNVTTHMEEAGKDGGAGLAEGMLDSAEDVTSAGTELAQDGVDAVKTALDSHSPSRVFAGIGEDVGAGMAEGINAGAVLAVSAAEAMAAAVSAIVMSAMDSLNGAIASTSTAATRYGAGGSYSANSSIYIGNYNQNGGGDVNALAAAMAASQRQLRRGFGGRV